MITYFCTRIFRHQTIIKRPTYLRYRHSAIIVHIDLNRNIFDLKSMLDTAIISIVKSYLFIMESFIFERHNCPRFGRNAQK